MKPRTWRRILKCASETGSCPLKTGNLCKGNTNKGDCTFCDMVASMDRRFIWHKRMKILGKRLLDKELKLQAIQEI